MRFHKTIKSVSNSKIKELLLIRKGRSGDKSLFIEGRRIVQTALDAGMKIKEAFVTEDFLSKHDDEIKNISQKGADVTLISERVAEKISDTETPQGIFATLAFKTGVIEEVRPYPGMILPVLDRVQDPGNLGTIIRTADAFGIQHLVLVHGTCSPLNQKVIRASAGSIFHLRIALTTPEELISWLKANDIQLCLGDARAEKSLRDIAPIDRAAVVLGNEASGVDTSLRDRADHLFKIPMQGRVESLNVGIAAAIILYELTLSSGKER